MKHVDFMDEGTGGKERLEDGMDSMNELVRAKAISGDDTRRIIIGLVEHKHTIYKGGRMMTL